MELIRVHIDNEKNSDEFIKEVCDLIIDAGKNGLMFKGYVPSVVSTVGKITAYDLVFGYEIDPIDYVFDTAKAENCLLAYVNFKGLKEIIDKHEDDDEIFCGFCPVRTEATNRLSEILLVFKDEK